ncbi:MAG: hypothetical protein WB562_19265 [Candidatus Sulfotelmatobacter sp.]
MPATAARYRLPGLVVLCLFLSASFGAQDERSKPDLTAHEWGTFTSIAGRDGQAKAWLPQTGSTDLPGFVEHLREVNFKAGVRGTVRMETPVLYFYSPQEMTLSVRVSFAKGLITEWYPRASHVEPGEVSDAEALYQRHASGSVTWNSVTVAPTLAARFPTEGRGSQYYAARETSAAPLIVKSSAGSQQEKFLFYRGVSTFAPPISATLAPNGGVRISNLAREEVPIVILFERRGDKLGYRLGGALQSEISLEPPELTATFDSMSRDLENILTAQGLFPDEARAMIETWRQSWFEEGSRLFYVVPGHFVNTILPLAIHPAPSQITRVFVGRLELITPATEQAVQQALAAHDAIGLRKYTRFLQPILEELKTAHPAKAQQLETDLGLTYSAGAVQPPSTK